MYLAELRFPAPPPDRSDEAERALWGLLAALERAGRILGGDHSLARADDGYVAAVPLPEPDAVAPEFAATGEVGAALDALAAVGLGWPEARPLGRDTDWAGPCACPAPPCYLLLADFLSVAPPVRCGGCLRPVPLYRLPPTDRDHYGDLLYWQAEYRACDTLWMLSGPGERWAQGQLSRADSALARLGRGACRRVEDRTGVSAYYRLLRAGGRSQAKERERRCPSCGGAWLLEEPWHHFDFRCDGCRLVSGISPDVG